jgi:hypothetical protein
MAVLMELPRGFQDVADIIELGGGHLERDRLAVLLDQARLGVEGVDLGGAAVHEQEDDALRPRGVVRSLPIGDGGGRLVGEEGGEGHSAEAVGALLEHLAPGERFLDKAPAMHQRSTPNGVAKVCPTVARIGRKSIGSANAKDETGRTKAKGRVCFDARPPVRILDISGRRVNAPPPAAGCPKAASMPGQPLAP